MRLCRRRYHFPDNPHLQDPSTANARPPLLFVHGSYHAAWCWAEKWMPYFSSHGFNTYAVSLRAQGNSDCISNEKDTPVVVAGTLDSHCQDLGDLIAEFPKAPVVVGHSFGGLILQKYLSCMKDESEGSSGLPQVAGTGFVCCVPPSGNKDMVFRFIKKDLWASIKITYGFVFKSFQKSLDAARELFFSDDLPQEDLERKRRRKGYKAVPAMVPLPAPPAHAPPAFVLGGEDDKVVDIEAVQELASVYKVKPIILPKMAHDCMLDTRWEQAAIELERWLLETVLPATK
ncbi:esterase-like protein [Dunaliella salina]|uniref:Esterase-like protein n=1 Tax=Dunaliella salina TaxID=3046 RepID=A0ABQ7H1S4_DUNSA|nr:esterase-like protein [Dunaliella salina]|eukprot:KAF5840806.1 esterase-like protein [Dunaliella salina]